MRPEYYVWMTIKARCTNPKASGYEDYGARGIRICRRWLGKRGFDNFISDMGARPGGRFPSGRALYTIDRKKNSGDYTPGNCIWTTYLVNQSHKRNSRMLRLGRRRLSLSDWARETGISLKTIHTRLARGWTVARALVQEVAS